MKAGLPFRYVGRYFRMIARLLFHPGRFFASMPLEGGVLVPLLFAVSTHWLSAAISFFWKVPVVRILQEGLREGAGIWGDLADDLSTIDHPGRHADSLIPMEAWTKFKELILPWFWGASSVLLDPFFTIATLLLAASMIFVAARVLVDSQQPIRFETVVRIVAFSSAPVLWKVIPLIGPVVAPLAVVGTTTIAFMEIYRTSLTRALTISLFPKVAVFGLLFGGLITLGWIAFRTFAALFGLQ